MAISTRFHKTLPQLATASLLLCIGTACLAEDGPTSVDQAPSIPAPESVVAETANSSNGTLTGPDFSRAEQRLIDQLPAEQIQQSINGNFAIVVQNGNNNATMAYLQGINNVTYQYQNGNALLSTIEFNGNNNSGSVFQSGNAMESGIRVEGSNKEIVHIQLNAEPGTIGEIVLQGRTPEEYVYVQRADGTESLYRR